MNDSTEDYTKITYEDLQKLVNDLLPKNGDKQNSILMVGKSFVRDYAKSLYGGSYTWKQLRNLFRVGMITGLEGIYTINS